jgi:hypothetical protein
VNVFAFAMKLLLQRKPCASENDGKYEAVFLLPGDGCLQPLLAGAGGGADFLVILGG